MVGNKARIVNSGETYAGYHDAAVGLGIMSSWLRGELTRNGMTGRIVSSWTHPTEGREIYAFVDSDGRSYIVNADAFEVVVEGLQFI